MTYNCKACNKEHSKNKSFCDNLCQGEYYKKLKYESWLVNCFEIKVLARNIRLRLLEIAEHKCSACGWGELNIHTGNIPLEIDHIDGNSENNIPENLQVLCPNCHSLTSTYKGANKESKRTYRKKYYK